MKYSLLSVSLLIYSLVSVAQPFSFEKLYSHNVLSFDGVAHMHLDNNSQTIIVGNAEIGQVGDGEAVVVKIDSSGNILNSLIMGKPMYHDVCIQAMQQGSNYYFAGYTRSTDTSASPLFTSFLIKTDNNLNVLWQRNFIFPGNDFIFKTASLTPSGDFLFSGNNYEFASGNWYSFILKTNANGVVKLCKMSNAFLSIDPGFIAELNDHDIFLTGSVTLGFEMVVPTAVRFDSLGNMKWAKALDYDVGSPQQSKFLYAKELPSGNILLSGHSDYSSAANLGLMDYQVFKVDSAGNVLWMKTYGAGLTDWLYGADFNSSTNELVMMGTTQSYASNNLFYGYVITADTSGIVTNAFVQGDTTASQEVFIYNTCMLNSGSAIFSGADMSSFTGFYASKYNPGYTGPASCHSYNVNANSLSAIYPEYIYSVSPFPLDINILINALPFDYYTGANDSMLCYNDVTSISNVYNLKLEAYPNPASNVITFKSSKGELDVNSIYELKDKLKIYNFLGNNLDCKIVYSRFDNAGIEFTLDISLSPSGIFILEFGGRKTRFEIIR